jgi:hypothetical protein
MSREPQAVQALLSLRIGRKSIYILPLRALVYGLISLLVVIGVALVIDCVLGGLESAGWTSGERWLRSNKIVEANHRQKTTTNECQPRWWQGQPLRTDASHKILVMGDSFVWGPPYLTLNHLWWRQLAIELERRGYRDVDVVAVGHPGWSTHRQLECARKLIPEIKPDLVIWGYVTNDPDEKIVRQIFDSQDQPPFGQRIRRKLQWLLPNLEFKFESLRNDKLSAQYTGPEYGYAYADWELKLVEGENFSRYRETVEEAGELMRETAVPTFLMTLPHFPSREYFEPRYAPVLPLWKGAGIPVVNTLDAFIDRYGAAPSSGPESIKWGINPADSHPGPTTTHFYATQAADYLEQKWPQLLGTNDAQRPHELVINDWLPSDLGLRQVGPAEYELDYPVTTGQMPQFPSPPAALVALRYPLPLAEVHLRGDSLRRSQMWALFQDEDQFEPETWHDLDRTAELGIFIMPAHFQARPVSALRFTADCLGQDRRLRISLSSAAVDGAN